MNNSSTREQQKVKEDYDGVLSVAAIKASRKKKKKNRGKKRVTWKLPLTQDAPTFEKMDTAKNEMVKRAFIIDPLFEPIPGNETDTRATLYCLLKEIVGGGCLSLKGAALADFYKTRGLAVTPALTKSIKVFSSIASLSIAKSTLRDVLDKQMKKIWIGQNDSVQSSNSSTPGCKLGDFQTQTAGTLIVPKVKVNTEEIEQQVIRPIQAQDHDQHHRKAGAVFVLQDRPEVRIDGIDQLVAPTQSQNQYRSGSSNESSLVFNLDTLALGSYSGSSGDN